MANIGLDTTQHERTAPSGAPLPPGVYTMTVVRTQMKQVKNNGVQLEVEFDISSPAQFSNRKFWDRFNLINNSPKKAVTEKIAQEALSDLAKASGINGILHRDEELLGKTVQGRLIVKLSDDPQYPEPKNKCRKYYPVGVDADAADKAAKGGVPVAQVAVPAAKANWNNAGTPLAQPQQAAPAVAGAAPWKR